MVVSCIVSWHFIPTIASYHLILSRLFRLFVFNNSPGASVEINEMLALVKERLLPFEGPDGGDAEQRFAEQRINRGFGDGFEAFDLARSLKVETLEEEKEEEEHRDDREDEWRDDGDGDDAGHHQEHHIQHVLQQPGDLVIGRFHIF